MLAPDLQIPDALRPSFEDALDDRIAEILDEMLGEGDPRLLRRRPSPALAALGLLVALVATVLLRHSTLAVASVWLSTAIVCLAAAPARQATMMIMSCPARYGAADQRTVNRSSL